MGNNNSGWNRSSGSEPVKKNDAKVSSLVKVLVAGVLVLVIGALCVYLFSGEGETEKKTASKGLGRIKEVTPAKAPKAEEPAPPPKKKPFWEVPASETNGFTRMMQHKWEHAHRPPPGYTNTSSRTEPPPAYAIFPHNSENTIAAYLTMEPGETLVGTPHYGPKFTKDFLESLKVPIIPSKDDSPEVQELKRLMNETKIDLKARYDAGEDIGKILEATHEEYQQLAAYKASIRSELLEFKKNPDATMEDVEDFVKAANMMLEKKGIAPLKLSPISKRMLMRRKGNLK